MGDLTLTCVEVNHPEYVFLIKCSTLDTDGTEIEGRVKFRFDGSTGLFEYSEELKHIKLPDQMIKAAIREKVNILMNQKQLKKN